jgi:rare lipoprotein A
VDTYKIQSGDTIARVTNNLGMSWDEFRKTNPDAVGRSARTGKWIIKAGAVVKRTEGFQSALQEQQSAAKASSQDADTKKTEGQWTEITVKQGDTLWGLARTVAGMTVAEMAKANRLPNPDHIKPGQKLRVRSVAEAPVQAQAVAVPASAERTEIVASWYGKEYHGRPMANGKIYNMHADTIAHRTLPLGTTVSLTNPDTGVTTAAVVTDRGPFVDGRDVDLSYSLAKKLSMVEKGVGKLLMEVMPPST